MSKTYTEYGHLQSETFFERVELDQWLNIVVTENYEPMTVFNFLKNAGRYYDQGISEYPEKIILPEKTERGRCHENNLQYAKLILNTCPEIITDFKFVTGLWGLKAKTRYTRPENRYFIGCHSFMAYKGLTLDCTILNHSPEQHFSVDQYFGISFELLDVLIAFERAQVEGIDLSKVPVIEILRHTPYLKE